MRIDIVSLFPEFVAQCAAFGVVGRAQERALLSLHGWNPRDYATGNYRRVDDRPFGGGPGMVMLIDPLRAAIDAARAADPVDTKVVYLSPQGPRLTQAKVRELAARPRQVPEVLMSGNHAEIARWRRMESLGRTWLRRPDLMDENTLGKADRALLETFRSRYLRGLDEPDGDA